MLINIKIKNEEDILVESSNIRMYPVENRFSKKFILKDCSYLKDIEKVFIDFDFVFFIIEVLNKHNESAIMYSFNFRIEDFKINQNNIHLLGVPIIDYDANNYDQNVIDIFMKWSEDKVIPFLSLDDDYKKSYNYSCLIWSGAPDEFNDSSYNIDLSLVKSDIDFYNMMGDYFFGNRGYFGHDSYSFEDILDSINRNLKEKIIIVFKRYSEISFQDKIFIDKIIRKKYQNIKFEIY
ncbi:hypothetical protein [Chryseobacterium carnipullorum]|uniref:hypothetical protein n=1 Tax=Chryseobacterium carnipullorum TaxID=1124835 RepID=UPI000E960081|nr:hypothetical protein [Chryseobacterium carnipullorum]HBV17306.1 hypothetical protein [Chryseobacterium carnipullorum]